MRAAFLAAVITLATLLGAGCTQPLREVMLEIWTDIPSADMTAYDIRVSRGVYNGIRTMRFYRCYERVRGIGACAGLADGGTPIRTDAGAMALDGGSRTMDPLSGMRHVTHGIVPSDDDITTPLIVEVRGLDNGRVVVLNAARIVFEDRAVQVALPLLSQCADVVCRNPDWVCDPAQTCPGVNPAPDCRCGPPIRPMSGLDASTFDIPASDVRPDRAVDVRSEPCVPECIAGNTTCRGDTPQRCVVTAGCAVWVAQPICAPGRCDPARGACMTCADVCPAIGTLACVDATHSHRCVLGASGCREWSAPVDCGAIGCDPALRVCRTCTNACPTIGAVSCSSPTMQQQCVMGPMGCTILQPTACGPRGCGTGGCLAACTGTCNSAGGCQAGCGENTCTCVSDCGPRCGDGCCNGGETCSSCMGDCGPCAPRCGDGVCNGTDNACNCPADGCAPRCGDGCCNGTDNACNCPGDSCAARCGDGCCNGGESVCLCGDCRSGGTLYDSSPVGDSSGTAGWESAHGGSNWHSSIAQTLTIPPGGMTINRVEINLAGTFRPGLEVRIHDPSWAVISTGSLGGDATTTNSLRTYSINMPSVRVSSAYITVEIIGTSATNGNLNMHVALGGPYANCMTAQTFIQGSEYRDTTMWLRVFGGW